ncbi:MAG: MBL fold metallo-hydrolase [Bacteroidota bacterium]
MLWVFGIILVFVAGGLIIGMSISAPKYKGAKSDHFDGKRFLNSSGKQAEGFGSLLKWAMNRDKQLWSEIKEAEYGAPPPDRVNSVSVTFINHSTFLLQVDGVNILTDPVYSLRCSPFQWAGPKRMRPPGIKFEDLPKIDYVIISHNHYDHLDENSVKRLKEEHDPQFLVPLGISAFMKTLGIEKSVDLDWWETYSIADSVEIAAVPAQHFSGRGMLDRDATLWCGYAIKRPGGNIYFAGDTGYNQEMFTEIGERFKPLKLSLIPIGAYLPRWFMSPIHTSPEDAVKAHKDLASEHSIATHFGTFPLADDGQVQPINDLNTALEKYEVPNERFQAMKEGETIKIE